MIKTLSTMTRENMWRGAVMTEAGLNLCGDVALAELEAFAKIARINAEFGRKALALWLPETIAPETGDDTAKSIEWNGQTYTIRRASVDDAAGLAAMYDDAERMTPDDIHSRFFGTYKNPGEQFLRIAQMDGGEPNPRYRADVYGIFDDEGTPVGEATWLTDDHGTAEVSYSIAATHRGRGADGEPSLIRSLVAHVADTWVDDPSIQSIHADVLASNVKSARILNDELSKRPEFDAKLRREDGDYVVEARRVMPTSAS